nr:MAG TPA: hypothetical protein [Caudoviricetes sp.]
MLALYLTHNAKGYSSHQFSLYSVQKRISIDCVERRTHDRP